MHPASLRAITEFWKSLAVERLSLGIVKKAEDSGRGYAIWLDGLTTIEFMAALPRAAAANVSGSHIYVRVCAPSIDQHPGILLLDDLDRPAIYKLGVEGLEPTAVVETSPDNYQAWIRLVPAGQHLAHSVALAAVRLLIERFGADPRASSPTQPGRLVGFTNRKPAYFNRDRYPFVRLISARPGLVAPSALDLLKQAEMTQAQPAAPRAAPRETPQAATLASGDNCELNRLRDYARRRVADQLRAGQRDPKNASESEVDWLAVCLALRAGLTPAVIESWLLSARPDRDTKYAARTLNRAAEQVLGGSSPRP